jgi:hypothetical protein
MAVSIAHPAFMTFLVNAKCQTYAAQGDAATVTPLVPGSRQLEYQEGTLLHRDIYFGIAYFVGQETVDEGRSRSGSWGMPVGSCRRALPRATWARYTSFCARHYAM